MFPELPHWQMWIATVFISIFFKYAIALPLAPDKKEFASTEFQEFNVRY
jgi:hypothetical protein